MSEGGEKTELPSPKKVRDARAKGQVARSQEVVTTVSLMSVIAYIWATWSITVVAAVSRRSQLTTVPVASSGPGWIKYQA